MITIAVWAHLVRCKQNHTLQFMPRSRKTQLRRRTIHEIPKIPARSPNRRGITTRTGPAHEGSKKRVPCHSSYRRHGSNGRHSPAPHLSKPLPYVHQMLSNSSQPTSQRAQEKRPKLRSASKGKKRKWKHEPKCKSTVICRSFHARNDNHDDDSGHSGHNPADPDKFSQPTKLHSPNTGKFSQPTKIVTLSHCLE